MITLAIDPGTRSTGFAFFDSGKLERVVRVTKLRCNNLGIMPYEEIRKWKGCVSHLACEVPQIYPQSKADPNDMIPVALLAGALIGYFSAAFVKMPRPREWKGQVPKAIHNARTLAKLTDDERALCAGHSHDELDAVGIGLWYLGR